MAENREPETIFAAGCTVRGFFPCSQAKKHGKMIQADLAEIGVIATPIAHRVGWRESILYIQISCDESLKPRIISALEPLGFNFEDF